MFHFIGALATFLVAVSVCALSTIDEQIAASAETSRVFSRRPHNDTIVVEYDIRLTPEQFHYHQKRHNGTLTRRDVERAKRKGIHGQRWRHNIVPYDTISEKIFSADDIAVIKAAMDDYHLYSCLRFRPAQNERAKIYFQGGIGCSSAIGRQGWAQGVELARGCRKKGIVIHELGHAIGWYHEQSRPDRDNFVDIVWDVIPDSDEFNFHREDWDEIKDFKIPYDYSSVMHYGQYYFSYSGKKTIVAKDSRYQNIMGNRRGFSFRDIKLVNAMYPCNLSKCSTVKSCPGEGFVGRDCRCWCPRDDLDNPVQYCDDGGDIQPGKEGTDGETGDGGDTDSGNGGGTTVVVTGDCKDKSPQCSGWSLWLCDVDPDDMKFRCPASCGFCKPGNVPSETSKTFRSGFKTGDMNPRCRQFAAQGECGTNHYMKVFCKNACKDQ